MTKRLTKWVLNIYAKKRNGYFVQQYSSDKLEKLIEKISKIKVGAWTEIERVELVRREDDVLSREVIQREV